jgi:photoactive yellow protein
MSPTDDRSPDPGLQARWDELCDILNVQDSEEALARVQELQLDAMQETAEVAAGTLDTSEAYDLLQRIDQRVETLRERTAPWSDVLAQLKVDHPEEVPEVLDEVLERLNALEDQHDRLVDAGIAGASEALSMIESMEEQLRELYQEKESTIRAQEKEGDFADEDTFDQLQRLMAREERLQRELGVTSSEEVIEMVRGLASQLDELYADRDVEQPVPPVSAGDGSQPLSEREQKLQRELGVSDPSDVIAMVNGLVRQLEELYEARERLAQVNLEDAESVINMISSMEEQLEALYADQERMSEQGIDSIDQAISMIESMEAQLGTLYEERHAAGEAADTAGVAADQMAQVEEKLEELAAEKKALQEQRDALASGSATDTLQRELGVSDPEHVVQLVQSMEQQLQDLYADREQPGTEHSSDHSGENSGEHSTETRDDVPHVLDPEEIGRLASYTDAERNDFDAGILRVDDEGRVQSANDAAAQTLPGVAGSTGDAMVDRNFFFSIAPGTSNSLFRGRFKSGIADDDLDVRFAYTIIHPTEPRTNLAVHLYRTGPNENWILFRRLSG